MSTEAHCRFLGNRFVLQISVNQLTFCSVVKIIIIGQISPAPAVGMKRDFSRWCIEVIETKVFVYRQNRSIIPLGVPNVLFNGYNSSFFSQLSAEVGALWITEYIKGGVELPSAEYMNAWIDERLVWMKERTDGKHAKGTNIIPFSVHQMDELLGDIDLELGVFTRIKQWFAPVVGSDFKNLTKRLQKRHGIN